MTEGLPEHIALRPDASTRRSADGRTFLGGEPLRLLRFDEVGARAADRVLSGRPVGGAGLDRAVARRLLDAGMAHPTQLQRTTLTTTIVIPVRDDADSVGGLLDALVQHGAPPVIVVDDGSDDAGALVRAVAGRADIVRHDHNQGPAAARNTGWRRAATELVAFVDADVEPPRGWLEELSAHFGDEHVAIVAPRVTSLAADRSRRVLWEAARSPLDLGAEPARVVPLGRVGYVPSAALVARRAVLDRLDGFDESRRVGEDVDLVWRAVESGATVRYEPAVQVHHRPRGSWPAVVRQRFDYGSAAAGLDARHPGRAAPLAANVWSLAAWALILSGRRRLVLAGVATGAGSTAALVPRLRGRVDEPVRTAVALAGGGTVRLGEWIGRATWRAWLPLAVALATRRRRVAGLLALAAAGPALLAHRRAGGRPDTGIGASWWTVLWAADDAAYCAGVWRGALRQRSLRCLLPALTGIPGVTRRDHRHAAAGIPGEAPADR